MKLTSSIRPVQILHNYVYILSDEVITFTETTEPADPGAFAVKVESKNHVFIALDYTDETKPKLLAIEDVS